MTLPLFVALVVLGTVSNASAQSFSAQGPSIGDAQVETNNCRSVALTLFQRINVLEARVQNIIDCHARGELYDTDAADCAPEVSPPHQFSRNGGDVASLAFEDTDGNLAAPAYVGGEPGADIQCEPEAASPSPAPSDPADCTAPWGAPVANGDSVTAYEQDSVPSGSSCVNETRTCTDGILSGGFTQQNCTVAAAPTPRERLVCVRSGVTWEQGQTAVAYNRRTNETLLCCMGVPESSAGSVAGIVARQHPNPREHCSH